MEWCLDTVIADNLYMDVVDFSTSASYFIIILLIDGIQVVLTFDPHHM